MTPGLVNFICPQGSTFRRTLTYSLDNIPIDLSGYSSRLQVRTAHYATEPLITLVSGSGLYMGGSLGTIDILISDDDTSLLPAGNHVYDLEIINPSNETDRLIEGTFSVTPEVTR